MSECIPLQIRLRRQRSDRPVRTEDHAQLPWRERGGGVLPETSRQGGQRPRRKLTFPEFLLMWREAQDEDELIEVIREHDLFPDVIKIDYYRKKPEQVETVKRTTRNQSECPCGCEYTTTETYRKSPKEESVEYETTSVSRKSDERLPVFSCYR
ncbi:uncharacterized protein CEXT_343301 [Caerostris extrusa]|uniref:Uncharacterized protein n=1 Tax=Caerostris extrusa TaxID=172846 RepID=A0AAV4VG61_CAEEX|nr:uncharacterized protein CEXT_343301 [Caerostris extrusa]